MSDAVLLQWVVAAYVVTNGLRVVSYLPQIVALARAADDARVLALSTWCFWTVSNATTALYAALVLRDAPLAWLNAGIASCCAVVIAITLYKRRKYGDRRGAASAAGAQPGGVASIMRAKNASHAATCS